MEELSDIMENIKSNLYDCQHCKNTGTCHTGNEGNSCLVCAKKAELPFWNRKNHKGLICSSCGGIGKTEPLTERINKRTTPLLAIYLVILLLALLFISAFTSNKYFNEILAFSSTIIGSIVGYYFSNKKT